MMKTDEIINILGKMSSQIRNRADRQACLPKLAMPDPCLIAKLAPLQGSERHSEKSPNTFSPTLITTAIALTCFYYYSYSHYDYYYYPRCLLMATDQPLFSPCSCRFGWVIWEYMFRGT